MSESPTKHTVLIIDDEIGPRESLRMLLKHEFDVIVASSVDAGLEVLKKEAPEVIVMDIRMPGKTGIEGLKEVRDIDPLVSVVMLTGFGALETAQEAMRYGANDYIKKPFDAPEMMEVVKKYARRTRVQRRGQHAERSLKELNDKLLSEIEQKDHMATLGQASAEFIHDLRNPLTIVLGYVQLLTEQLVSAKDTLGGEFGESVEYLDVIEKNVHRCTELAQMWQNYGKGDDADREPTAMGPLLRDLVTGVEPLVSGRRAEIECRLSQNGASVMGSKPQLLRAIHNLVANAIHAIPEDGGRIRIDCHCEGEDLLVEIADNGCGIPEESREKVFEPYFTTKINGQGTGLGLYIAKRIIEEHDGSLTLDSEVDKGTTIDIRLPLIPSDAASS